MLFGSNVNDRQSISSKNSRISVAPRKQMVDFNKKSKAAPTLSLNLDNTNADTPQLPAYLLNVPSRKTLSYVSSNASLRDSIRSYPSSRKVETLLERVSVQSSPTEQLNQAEDVETAHTTATSNHSRGDDIASNSSQQVLIEFLAESMYSYPPSLVDSRKYRSPIVSNELPSIFEDSRTDGITIGKGLGGQDTNFFILSSAGKPIFVMNGEDKEIIPLTGIINTVINYFQVNEQTNLKSIFLRKTQQRYVFLNRAPIIIMIYSNKGESIKMLENQLDFLYSYLLSTLTSKNLIKLFKNRSNFDLGTFLAQTDIENLKEICALLSDQFYPDIFLNALQSHPLRKTIRQKIHSKILQQLADDSKLIPRGTLLYGLLLTGQDTKMTAVIRPRGHTLHTSDLQLLFCLIRRHFHTNTDRELWIPICFPKFNSTGFLYSYIRFLSFESRSTLVLISAQKDSFFKLKLFSDRLIDRLMNDRRISSVLLTSEKQPGFRVKDIPAPLIHHFIYKSKTHVQYVMPTVDYSLNFENILGDDEAFTSVDSQSSISGHNEADHDSGYTREKLDQQHFYQKKLQSYYRELHNSLISEEGNEPLSETMTNFIQWEGSLNHNAKDNEEVRESMGINDEKVHIMGMVWCTPQFELYVISNNGVNDKKTILYSARRILQWCKKYDQRLFIQNGAVF